MIKEDIKLVTKVEKLIALSGNNPNESERTSAAVKACLLIRENNIKLVSNGTRGGKNEYEAAINELKKFYRKMEVFNGSEREIVLRMHGSICSLCQNSMKIGDIASWIPKTRYVFHPECWAKLRVKHAPR